MWKKLRSWAKTAWKFVWPTAKEVIKEKLDDNKEKKNA